jgi:cyanophycin synthetase
MTQSPPADPVVVDDARLLEGPNLSFPKPAAKLALVLPGYADAAAEELMALASRVGMRRLGPGEPQSERRQRFLMRLVEHAIRRTAAAAGTTRLGIRVRPGSEVDSVTAAFVWRNRGRARALVDAVPGILRDWLEGAGPEVVLAAAEQVRASAGGEPPRIVRPRIPVASITGTNGKTTTTRLLAHLAMTAGLRTAWSSTDGVVVQGETVEPGDYSGPAGARGVLEAEGVQIGILETARGGMLLKGLGVTHNDVSVVTNVTADHLGHQGIDTVDQLAEVKAIITRATKQSGWAVLNGDDPRVWAMRTGSPAKPWVFTLDPASPALRESLAAGGRGITVLDGAITTLHPNAEPQPLVDLADVPLTLSGLSKHNTANALAATAAALALGLSPADVAAGLRTFVPDARLNPGRMNIFSLDAGQGGRCTVVLDMAHNEAGLEALLDVARGLAAPGGRVHLVLGAVGDRTDELIRDLAAIGGVRADHVVLARKEKYLRGRTVEELEGLLREGLLSVGVADPVSYPSEIDALSAVVEGAADGDVVALMSHAQRQEGYDWLAAHGATPDDAATIRRKVVTARGEHEAEAEIVALWAMGDAEQRVGVAADLAARFPGDGRVTYEYAGSHDSAGHPDQAVPLYRDALATGLPEPYAHRAKVQLASSLRNLGETAEAARILRVLAAERPESVGIAAFAALALRDAGDPDEALRTILRAVAATSADEDVTRYRRSLTAYAESLGR